MFTFRGLTAALLLLALVAIKLSLQDGISRREAKVEQIIEAFEKHHSSDTTGSHRSKRHIPLKSRFSLRLLLLSIVMDCFEYELGLNSSTTPATASTTAPVPTTTYPRVEGPCISPYTVNLTEYWRKDKAGSDIQPDGEYNCDADLFDNEHWFRITGAAGNQIRNTCSPAYSCGSHGGIWTDAKMPSDVGEIRQVELYGSWDGDCSWYSFAVDYPLTVQRCSPSGDFVYKIDGTTGCYHSVCGMD